MMDRVNGWYKRKIGLFLFWIGFIICIAGNVDTFKIVTALTKNEAYKKELVTHAQKESSIVIFLRYRGLPMPLIP